MGFTLTLVNTDGPIPDGPYLKEIYTFVNTAGSTGGAVPARWLSAVLFEETAGVINSTRSGATATIITDSNASGSITLIGRGN